MNEQWIDKIRQQMDRCEADVPDGLFDDIMGEMSRRGIKPASQPRRRRAIPLWVERTAAAVVAAAAVALVAVWLLEPAYRQPASTGHSSPVAAAIDAAPACGQPTLNALPAEGWVARVRRVLTPMPSYTEQTVLLADNAGATEPAPAVNHSVANAPAERVEPSAQPAEKIAEPHHAAPATGHRSGYASTPVGYVPPRHRGGQWDLAAYMQGTSNRSSGVAVSPMRTYLAQDAMLYGDNRPPTQGRVLLQHAAHNQINVRHRLPIKGGVSLRYHIDDRWSVQTGVNYSYHSSEIETGGQTTQQRLHFIGVPVAVSYSVWSNRHASVYVSAGGEAEKMVSGHREAVYGDEHRDERVKLSQLQLSATLAAGIEYKPTPVVGVYIEPGGAYHFDTGGDVNTVYSDRRMDFSLNMGVRINLGR